MEEKNVKTNNIRHKKNGGITLIALVITIIVMLILVAVTVSIAVNGGLFNYAKQAAGDYDTSRIQEELQVGIYGLQMEYYQNGEAGSLRDFIFDDAEGKGQELLTTELGAINLVFDEENNQITYKGVTFNVAENGGVTYAGIAQSAQDEQGDETGTTLADITSANYGDYINLGTSILPANTTIGEGEETIKADWRIFYKDSQGNVYAKLADYLPVDTGIGASVTSSLRLDTYGKYGVYVDYSGDYTEDYEGQDYGIGDRNIFLEKLNGNWNGLLSGSNIATIQNQLGTKVNVKGAVDLPTWVASWNSNAGYTQLSANYDNDAQVYLIGDDHYVRMSNETGYNNTLYFPNRSESGSGKDDCYGCWVASPGPGSPDVEGIVWYEYDICGGLDAYDFYFGNWNIGVSPVVILESDIPVEEVEDSLWEVQ